MSAELVAAAINTAIGRFTDLPVTAGVAAAVVTLTGRHGGDIDLDVRGELSVR